MKIATKMMSTRASAAAAALMLLLVLPMLLLASSAFAAAAPSPAHSKNGKNKGGVCSSGCALSANLVCGADGVTYMGDCLARCAGTTIAYRSACQPPNTDAQRAALAAGPSANPSDLPAVDVRENPFAHEFALGLKRYPRASGKDINRFLSRGLVLAGYLGSAGTSSGNGGSADGGNANDDKELTVDYDKDADRLTAQSEGLVEARPVTFFDDWVYVSRTPISEAPADWSTVPDVSIFTNDQPPAHVTLDRRRRSLLINDDEELEQAKFERGLWGEVDGATTPGPNTVVSPLRAVGQVIVTINYNGRTKELYCSGTLVSPRHVLTSAACRRGKLNTGPDVEYTARSAVFIPNKFRRSGAGRGPFGNGARTTTFHTMPGYIPRSPNQVADNIGAWAQYAVAVLEFRDPVINTRPEERAAARRLYGGDGSTVYMFAKKPEDPFNEDRVGSKPVGRYHAIAGIQRIDNRYSPSESHFLVCTNTNGRTVTHAPLIREPEFYKTCKAPTVYRGSEGIVNEGYAISMLYSELEKTGNWKKCCNRADNGMDGSPLYRLVYENNQEGGGGYAASAFVTGVLVYREDAKTTPSVLNDMGDAYAAIWKDVGKFVGGLTKGSPPGRDDWL